MVYVVQAEEREIPLDLLQQLAQVMAESKEIVQADATYRIRSSRGILRFDDREEADRVSRGFYELGLPNFVLDELLQPPKPERLNLGKPVIDEEVALAAVAKLRITTERKTTEIKPLLMRMSFGRIPMRDTAVQETTTKQRSTRFYLDVFTLHRHLRARTGTVMQILEFLGTMMMPGALLGEGAKRLMRGDRNVITFTDEKDYETYLKWLYQIRYAAPDALR